MRRAPPVREVEHAELCLEYPDDPIRLEIAPLYHAYPPNKAIVTAMIIKMLTEYLTSYMKIQFTIQLQQSLQSSELLVFKKKGEIYPNQLTNETTKY